MKFGLHETAHEDVAVALEAEDLELDGMHQAVKQRALGIFSLNTTTSRKVRECMCVTSGRFTNPMALYSS